MKKEINVSVSGSTGLGRVMDLYYELRLRFILWKMIRLYGIEPTVAAITLAIEERNKKETNGLS